MAGVKYKIKGIGDKRDKKYKEAKMKPLSMTLMGNHEIK